MEQETAGVVSPQTETLNHETASSAELLARQRLATIAVSFGAIAGYGLKSVILLALSNHYHSDLIMPILFVLPAFLALALGLISRSRRGGAVSGAALAVTVIAAALLSMWQTGGRTTLGSTDFQIFALMIGGGALLGAAGAQTRRVVSRRLARNRSRRTIVRPGAS